MSGIMGPAVLITLGILFFIDQFSWGWHYGFGRTWPVLLIVIGIVKVLQFTAPVEGHVPVGYVAPPSVVTPPPAPNAGSLTDSNDVNREDGHV